MIHGILIYVDILIIPHVLKQAMRKREDFYLTQWIPCETCFT